MRRSPMAASRCSPHVVERVRSADGKTLYARSTQEARPHRRCALCGDDERHDARDAGRGTAHKADLPGWQAAGKTGTSQDFRDAWFIGYTAHLVTGVWLGNDDYSPTRKATGGGLPVEIWSRFMKVAHQGVPPAALPGLAGAGWLAAAPAQGAGGVSAGSGRPSPLPPLPRKRGRENQ